MATPNENTIYDWHDYFMCIACLAALRSADPKTKVGACIVNQNNNVVGIGYNCMPGNHDKQCEYPHEGRNPNDKFPDAQFDYNKKFLYVVHAAVNAILNKTVASLEGCTIYLTMPVDADCAHAIIQSGIKIVYEDNFDSDPKRPEREDITHGKKLLKQAGITVVPYKCSNEPEVTLTDGKTGKTIISLSIQQTDDGQQSISLTPHQFFMAIAMLSQKKQGHHERKPEMTQGACIVSECDKKVISIGHSGYPDQVNRKAIEFEKYHGDPFIVHAEYNAILAKGVPSLKGCTLYVTKYPCHGCAQVIVQAGISKVIYAEEKPPKLKPENDVPPSPACTGGNCEHENLEKCRTYNSYLASQRILKTSGITDTSYETQQDRVEKVELIIIDRKKL